MRFSPVIRGLAAIAIAASVRAQTTSAVVTPNHIRFVLSALADDSMEGRGTGMPGSMKAARFIAEQFRLAGLTPAGDSGYFQHVPMATRMLSPSSTLRVNGTTLRAAVDFAVSAGRTDPRSLDGVQAIYGGVRGDTANALTPDQVRGKLVIFSGPAALGGRGARGARGGRAAAPNPLADAAGVASIEGDALSPRTIWAAKHTSTGFTRDPSAQPAEVTSATVSLTRHAAEVLLGTSLESAKVGATGPTIHSTVSFIDRPALGGNVVGMVEGSDPAMKDQVVLVDAHYDHLGIAMPAAGSTDSIYNGADDDASGTTAVIEIARAIKSGPPPKRTLIFMATTGEEAGLVGTNWYIAHPVRPLSQMVANLEIEMIDRPDSLAGGPGKAWLTGYERSTMGDTLAAHGVPIVKDPRPSQNFFLRSDNIAYARMGIPAHTLSTFDLHADYHHADDEVRLADFNHMAGVISAAVTAVRLLGDGFRPEWHEGGRP
jgi:hypothetical protein